MTPVPTSRRTPQAPRSKPWGPVSRAHAPQNLLYTVALATALVLATTTTGEVVPQVGGRYEAWNTRYLPLVAVGTRETLNTRTTSLAVIASGCRGVDSTPVGLGLTQQLFFLGACTNATLGKDVVVYVPRGAVPMLWDTSGATTGIIPYDPNFDPRVPPWCGTHAPQFWFSIPRVACNPWAARIAGAMQAWNPDWPPVIFITVDSPIATDATTVSVTTCGCLGPACGATLALRVDTVYFSFTCPAPQPGVDINVTVSEGAVPLADHSTSVATVFELPYNPAFDPRVPPWCGSAPRTPFMAYPRYPCAPAPTPGPSVAPVLLGAFTLTLEVLSVLGAGPRGALSRAAVHDASAPVLLFLRPDIFMGATPPGLSIDLENCNREGWTSESLVPRVNSSDLLVVCSAQLALPISVALPTSTWTLVSRTGASFVNYGFAATVAFAPAVPWTWTPLGPQTTWTLSGRGSFTGTLVTSSTMARLVAAARGASLGISPVQALVSTTHGGFRPVVGLVPAPGLNTSGLTSFSVPVSGCVASGTGVFTRIDASDVWALQCTTGGCGNISVGAPSATLPCEKAWIPQAPTQTPGPISLEALIRGSASASYTPSGSPSGSPSRSTSGSRSSRGTPSRSGSLGASVSRTPSETPSPSATPSPSQPPTQAWLESELAFHHGPGTPVEVTVFIPDPGATALALFPTNFILLGCTPVDDDDQAPLPMDTLGPSLVAFLLSVTVGENWDPVAVLLQADAFNVSGVPNEDLGLALPYRPLPVADLESQGVPAGTHNGSAVLVRVTWTWAGGVVPDPPPVPTFRTQEGVTDQYLSWTSPKLTLGGLVTIHPGDPSSVLLVVPDTAFVDSDGVNSPLPGLQVLIQDGRPSATASSTPSPSASRSPGSSPTRTTTKTGARSPSGSRSRPAPASATRTQTTRRSADPSVSPTVTATGSGTAANVRTLSRKPSITPAAGPKPWLLIVGACAVVSIVLLVVLFGKYCRSG